MKCTVDFQVMSENNTHSSRTQLRKNAHKNKVRCAGHIANPTPNYCTESAKLTILNFLSSF
ncbi:Protein CBG25502 [Caenorhabditis briggsae]|uniref:Protein CBG25502 n=1 Tax=Caenorhabditis briggsae TaxID=6238 RepID=B6IEP2_CAEBR|nr:Protein CBG25502 [Caenorhabditis briggsae]CAR98372.1 Protein CBG25502 [Caenorhabditis briggsae]